MSHLKTAPRGVAREELPVRLTKLINDDDAVCTIPILIKCIITSNSPIIGNNTQRGNHSLAESSGSSAIPISTWSLCMDQGLFNRLNQYVRGIIRARGIWSIFLIWVIQTKLLFEALPGRYHIGIGQRHRREYRTTTRINARSKAISNDATATGKWRILQIRDLRHGISDVSSIRHNP